MKYQETIEGILKNIGGEDNIQSVTHCITRLRFVLKDESKGDIDAVKQVPGVVSCLLKGGQFQVVIGAHVSEVYDELLKTVHIVEGGGSEKTGSDTKKSLLSRLFSMLCDTMSSIVMPIIGPLAASGMIKAAMTICVQFGLLDNTSQTYQIFYMVADGVFYFMPMFLAFSAGKKFGCNPYLSVVFGAMLVNPTYIALKEAGDPVTLLGLPVTLASYTSSIVPIIFITYFQSKIERLANRFTPNAIKVFFVPLVVSLITVPVGFVVLGPLGSIVGSYLAQFFTFLETKVNWLVPMLIGGFCPLLVMTGMHYALGSAQTVQRATMGYATIMAPGMVCSNMAQAASTLAVALKSKNAELKTLASSVGITALCGITEPTLYGVGMKYKTPLFCAMAGGAAGGLFAGITQVKQWAYGTSTIFATPVYIGPDSSFMNILIAIAIAMAVAFVLSFITFKDPVDASPSSNPDPGMDPSGPIDSRVRAAEVCSPLKGDVVDLASSGGAAFESGALGRGCAIVPTAGEMVAPFDGVVTKVFESGHAISMKSEDGVEVLIHVGTGNETPDASFFTHRVKSGDTVRRGDVLMSIDLKALADSGCSVITPVVVSNASDFLDVIETNRESVERGDALLTIIQ